MVVSDINRTCNQVFHLNFCAIIELKSRNIELIVCTSSRVVTPSVLCSFFLFVFLIEISVLACMSKTQSSESIFSIVILLMRIKLGPIVNCKTANSIKKKSWAKLWVKLQKSEKALEEGNKSLKFPKQKYPETVFWFLWKALFYSFWQWLSMFEWHSYSSIQLCHLTLFIFFIFCRYQKIKSQK